MRNGSLRIAGATAAIAIALALTGCTSATPAATPSPTASRAIDTTLTVRTPATITAETAQTETVRLADAMQKLIDPTIVLNTDNHAQLVDKTTTAGSYYAVLRAVSITASDDPISYAQALVTTLEDAGWIQRETSNANGIYLTALQGGDKTAPWTVLVGGDSSVEGQAVISLQLASPDLP